MSQKQNYYSSVAGLDQRPIDGLYEGSQQLEAVSEQIREEEKQWRMLWGQYDVQELLSLRAEGW